MHRFQVDTLIGKKKILVEITGESPKSPSLPGTFEDQGSGYPLKVPKVTLKWTGPDFTQGSTSFAQK